MQREKMNENKQNIQELWGNVKMCNKYLIGISLKKKEQSRRNI